MTKKEVIERLTKIKGIGKAKAEVLYKNGFDSLEKFKKATTKELVKIDGITEALAKELVNAFKEKPKPKKETKKPEEKPEIKKEAKPKEKVKEKEEKKVKKPKKEEKEEEEEAEEEEEYKVKKKPKLSKGMKKGLTLRKEIKKRTPKFLREEWFRYKRIPKNWRRPDGISSKMRINLKYRPSKVRVGFRGPKQTRGLHSSGFEEVIVFNVNDLNEIDPNTQAARIGSSVGTKKRIDIEKKAEKLEIRILNL
jgi:large subunit ribosomal protein L32e